MRSVKLFISAIFIQVFVLSETLASDVSLDGQVTQRKTLYLHVGPQKTGSSSIQSILFRNRERLKDAGLFLPIITGGHRAKDHTEIAKMIRQGLMTELFATMQKVEIDAGDARAIVLSSEQFSTLHENNNYKDFLSYLQEKFDLRIIYCLRDRAKRLASALCFSALYLTNDLLKMTSAKTYTRVIDLEENAMILFYARYSTTFLIFEDLAAGNKLSTNFLHKGLGLDLNVDEIQINVMGEFMDATHLNNLQLSNLEKFFSLAEGELSSLYDPAVDPKCTRLTQKIHELSIDCANKRQEKCMKELSAMSTSDYLANHPKLQAKYEQRFGYQGKVFEHIINAHRAVHSK